MPHASSYLNPEAAGPWSGSRSALGHHGRDEAERLSGLRENDRQCVDLGCYCGKYQNGTAEPDVGLCVCVKIMAHLTK